MSHNESDLDGVNELYDSALFRVHAYLSGGDEVHVGYWDDENRNAGMESGSRKLTQKMIELAQVKPGQRFIDFGCGLGGPGIKLATQKQCRLNGVTICEYQVPIANQFANQAGLGDQVEFILADANNTPYPDNHFDAGWFFETIFHIGRESGLREAARVLKPGAHLLIADITTLGEEALEWIEETDKLAVNQWGSAEDYPRLLDDAGFDLLESRDVTSFCTGPLAINGRISLEHHKDGLRQIQPDEGETIEEAIEYFNNLIQLTAANCGYVFVEARKR